MWMKIIMSLTIIVIRKDGSETNRRKKYALFDLIYLN